MNRWQLVQDLFEATAGLPAPERARVLHERLGAGDDDLAREVEDLCRTDREGSERLETDALTLLTRGAAGGLGQVAGDDAERLCGTTVGPYRFEQAIASGGMGHVFRALQSAGGVERRVAIKVLKRGLDTDALLARFRREQRTLAALHHENVVTFLDAGALPDGRPFLVMELVEGQPLTAWCEARALGIRERVELFLAVAAAVRHAHGNLVVHRDLKPSNLLVTGGGTPKLLDFGVAALLAEDEAGGQPGATTRRVGMAPATLGYASPEQLRGERVTTASDVFSLGVILYELLSGVPAFERRDDLDRLPEPPSRAALRSRGALDPRVRSRALRGDLDSVVLQALRPEPARRTSSVERLADDLERYLSGRPVSARPDTLAYRVAKFSRRNRWQVLVAALLPLALVTGLVGAEVGRRRATADASIGWSAHAQARQVARFLEDLLVDVVHGEDTALAGVLARSEAAVATELAGYPEAEALVRLALGRLYVERGRAEDAVRHLERVIQLAGSTRGLGASVEERARELLGRLGTR